MLRHRKPARRGVGALRSHYEKKPLGKETISEFAAFEITPLGSALLDALIVLAK
jgi:hypothetical protein